MATNTVYIPMAVELDPSKVEGYGMGASATCVAVGDTNIDLTLTDDVIITGLQLISNGASVGDYGILQVLAGALVVKTPIPGPWYLQTTGSTTFDLAFPMKIIAGLTIRLKITTTILLVTPTIAVNYRLWKVLS